MKTNYFSTKKTLLKSIIGLLGLTVVSCGTYQNKSFYDNDGIYGAEKQETAVQNEQTPESANSSSNSSNKYKEYFASNADKYSDDQSAAFTDVENYSSDVNQDENSDSNYGAWGTNSDNVTINVYDSNWSGYNYGYWGNYWGYRPWNAGIYIGWNSWNYGWCNPYWSYSGYYGPSWGGYNPYYYGGYYGYNNWNNGYYGNDYVYNRGRRGSYGNRYSNENYGANNPRNYTPRRNSTTSSTSGIANPRSYQAPPRRIGGTRTETNSGNNNNSNDVINTPRPRTSSPRSNDVINTPRPRTSSPRSESSSPRSYDSPRSSSSSSSGGASVGGGRSGGGRRG